MNRRLFLASAGGAALAPAQSKKPNLLVILADDMGFSDAGCYGGEIDTPNLDRLAKGGIRFTQAYSTARCMPSRGALLSGYYAQQSGLEQRGDARPGRWVRFAPQYLSPLGYRCYHSGKWHIGGCLPLRDTGFHHSYLLRDQGRFFSPANHALDDKNLPAVKPDEGYYATTAIADHAVKWLEGHRRENAADPFFLYLAFTSPHFPLHALQDDIRRFKDRYRMGWDEARDQRWKRLTKMGIVNCKPAPIDADTRPEWNTPDAELMAKIGAGEVTRAVRWKSLTKEQQDFQATKMAIHAAMVYRMDQEIGRVLKQLESMNAMRDTAILFLSDNGASSEHMIRGDGHDASALPGSGATHLCLGSGWASAANSPFRLHKSWVHEGGISSPLIVHWPASIREQGRLRHTPCHFIDVVPTLVDLAGGGKPVAGTGAPPLPGRSIVPAFEKDRPIERDFLFFNHSNNRALRVGDWKLVAKGASGPWELYNIANDRGEVNDLSKSQPDRARAMGDQWAQLESQFQQQQREGATRPNV